MPTAAEIERLEVLIGRLLPLSTKRRGELIAADDWNMLVGALIEVGRAAVASGVAETAPPHEHNDQVRIGWLDPRVRQLVTGGGVKDPGVDTELIKLRRDLSTLVGRVDSVGEDVARSRGRLDEVTTNDLVRQATLTRLDRKLLGAEGGRADIADLRTTLRTLQVEVGRAVEVGTRLEHGGEPIDVPRVVERVAAVEALRDRLTQPDGQLLDASALEVRLLELQTSLVTQDDLTEAIDGVRDDIGTGGLDLDSVLDAARLAGRESATSSVGVLGTELRSEVAARLNAMPNTVAAEVDRVAGSLREEVLAEARADLDAAVSSGDAAVREQLTARLEERLGATTAVIEESLAAIPGLVGSQVASEIGARLPDALGALEGRLEGVHDRIERLDEETKANADAIAGAETRLEATRREEAAAHATLRVEILDRITKVEDGLGPRVAATVDEARAALRTDIDASVTAARRDLEVRLAEVARQAAVTEVQVLSTSIRTDVQSIVRQEVDADLAAVRAEISAEIAGLNQRVAGIVSSEVARATANLPRLVSAEFETFRPEIERMVDARVNRRDQPNRPDRPPIR